MAAEGESPELFSLFVKYRSVPYEEREDFLSKLAEENELPIEDLNYLYMKFEWRQRALDMDAETEKQLHYKKLRNIRKLEEKQAYIGQLAQKFGTEQLKRMMARTEEDPEYRVHPGTAMALCDFGLRTEASSYGKASEVIEHRGGVSIEAKQAEEVDYSRLTDEELKDLQRLRNKARGLSE